MEHAPLERRPESASPQLSQGLSPQSFSETPLLSENDVDYSQIPPGFQKSYSLGELPTSPPERMQGQPNGVTPAPAPTLLAQSIALPAAGAGAGAGAAAGVGAAGAGAGMLSVIGAGAALIWGGPLAQPTGDATLSGDYAQRMRRQQVLQSKTSRESDNYAAKQIRAEAGRTGDPCKIWEAEMAALEIARRSTRNPQEIKALNRAIREMNKAGKQLGCDNKQKRRGEKGGDYGNIK